jgi:hypothetical protein
MNYLRIYNKLISRTQGRVLESVYTEKHHILPRCIGGTNNTDNIVELTAEEHFVAHQLLVKMHPLNHGLVYAASMMCVSSSDHNGNRSNNKLYGWLRRRLSISASIRSSGKGNHQFGTCWIHNLQLRISKKIQKVDLHIFLETGWIAGRIMNFDKPAKQNKRQLIKEATDARYLSALLASPSISAALRSLGMQTRGSGYSRMKDVIVRNNLQSKFAHDYIAYCK